MTSTHQRPLHREPRPPHRRRRVKQGSLSSSSINLSDTAGESLNLKVRIVNAGTTLLEDFQLVVGVFPRVTTRSDLESSFSGEIGLAPTSLPFDFASPVAANDALVVKLDESTSSFATLSGAVDGGVFPATVALRSADGLQTFDSLTHTIDLLPRATRDPAQHRIALAGDRRGPDAIHEAPSSRLRRRRGSSTVWTKMAGYADSSKHSRRRRSGRAGPRKLADNDAAYPKSRRRLDPSNSRSHLRRDCWRSWPISPTAIKPRTRSSTRTRSSPRAASDVLEHFRALMQGPHVQPVLVPYTFTDLPTLISELPLQHTIEQIGVASPRDRRHPRYRHPGCVALPASGSSRPTKSRSVAELGRRRCRVPLRPVGRLHRRPHCRLPSGDRLLHLCRTRIDHRGNVGFTDLRPRVDHTALGPLDTRQRPPDAATVLRRDIR